MAHVRRHGLRAIVIDTDAPERCTLLTSHMRKGGEATPHLCNICLTKMHANRECAPNWVQAPCCGEVWHESCMLRYAREARDGSFSCPQCKTKHTLAAANDWDASDVIDRIFPDVKYVPRAPDADDDAHPTTRRHTRSRGAPEELKRRTRSSGVYV
tara:strand:+ start:1423 stop:1890 length:468 start_codon:yes stop_codon:yes gene_type:complete